MRRAPRAILLATGLLAIGLPCAAPAAPVLLDAYDRWAAFRASEPLRCYAVATAVARTRGAGAASFVTVARFPPRGGAEVRVRLGRPHRPGTRVRLTIGIRSIDLAAAGDRAWAVHARADASIVAAMRVGEVMRIDARDPAGRPFREVYRLTGAASAIDAATLACLRGAAW